MSKTNTAVAIDTPVTVEEVDDLIQNDLNLPKTKRDGGAPPKLTKEEKALAKQDAAEAERQRIQGLVPWKVVETDGYGNYRQTQEITQWADDWGAYPRVYRSYTREEWTQAINVLAATVISLATTNPDYQRQTGVYVEEHSDDLLLIRAKKWQLVIEIPVKSTSKGKRVEL